jgi:hypothetical protein
MGPVCRFDEFVIDGGVMSLFACAAPRINTLLSAPARSRLFRDLRPSQREAAAMQLRFTFWTNYHAEKQASRAATDYSLPHPFTRFSHKL